MASKKKEIPVEKTVVLIKPDGVQRALAGEIIKRFENVGLKLVAMKMVWVDSDMVGKHYADKEDYHRFVGEKCLENYKKYGMDPNEEVGTMDPVEIGRLVRSWNMEYLTAGPVIAMIWEAPHAVEIVRKLIGHTFPQVAAPGTIRGDYAGDSTFVSNILKRSVKNMLHASGSVEEAEFESELWFRKEEIYSYKRADEDLIWG